MIGTNKWIEYHPSTSGTSGDASYKNKYVSKGNEQWEEDIITAGKNASNVIANNQILINLNQQIEGGTFTELGALVGNFSESVLGSSTRPRHPQQRRPLLMQMALQPALVTGPKHISPLSKAHTFPACLHSTHTE